MATGVGFYMYNAHSLFVVALGVFISLHLWRQKEVSWRRRVIWLLVWCVIVVFIASPLILYAINPANGYFMHFNRDSVYATGEWQSLSNVGAKLWFLSKRYLDYWNIAVWHPRLTDFIDATGVVAIIPPLLMILAAAGAFWNWKNLRGALAWMGICVLLLMPLGFVVTSGGLARRSFAAAPFVMCLAAIGFVETLRWLRARRHFRFCAGSRFDFAEFHYMAKFERLFCQDRQFV